MRSFKHPLHWLLTAKQQGVEYYELIYEQLVLMKIKVDTIKATVELESDTYRRKYSIEQKGFLQPVTEIHNEYGVTVGVANKPTFFSNNELIKLNDSAFVFKNYLNNNETTVAVFTPKSNKPLVTYQLNTQKELKSKYFNLKSTVLMLGVAWCLLMQQKN